uniref:Uncharacterized protein n=1 Tax=Arundo donax TaxID=35708 RepID=A0A0A9A9Z9_ARUDO
MVAVSCCGAELKAAARRGGAKQIVVAASHGNEARWREAHGGGESLR